MNKFFLRSFVWLIITISCCTTAAVAQTFNFETGSAVAGNPAGWTNAGIGTYYRGSSATLITANNTTLGTACAGRTTANSTGGSVFFFVPSVAITAISFTGTGTGSNRTFVGIATSGTIGGTFTTISGASGTGGIGTGSAATCGTISVTNIGTIAAGQFIRISLSGNINLTTVTITPSCTTPTAFTTSGTNTICAGTNTNVTTSGSQSSVTYELYKDNAATGTTQSGNGSPLNFSVSPAAQSTYTVRTTTAGGFCATTLSGSAVVSVNPLPTVSFTAAPTAAAVNAQATYTTQAGQSNYQWAFSGTPNVDYTVDLGGTTADNSATITWLTTGSKSVSVNYTNGNGCTAATATTANTTVNNNLNPPTLTAAVGASVDNDFNITYTDAGTPLYSSQISEVLIGATALTNGVDYVISTAGVITLKPSGGNTLLRTPGLKSVTVQAAGYNDANVSQQINAGAVTQLVVTTQPAAPSVNGSVLATQPVVSLRDQYNNVTSSNATVTASATGGAWIIGGTSSVNASSGTATFAGLTAGTSDGSLLTGATITFSIAGPITASSSAFNIPAYVSSTGDDFKSKNATGTWSNATDWLSKPPAGSTWYNSSLVPANTANSITIVNGQTMSVTASQTSANLTVEAGAELDINSGGTVAMGSGKTATINGLLKLAGGTYNTTGAVTNVDGASAAFTVTAGTLTGASATTLFFKNGGSYNHQLNGGTIPTANWTGTPPSTTNITGAVAAAPGGLNNNTFYNLTWNCPSQGNTNAVLGSNITNVFNVISTGTGGIQISSGSGVTAVTAGSYTQSGGTVFIFATSGRSLTSNGNFALSGGTFYISLSGQGTATTGVNLNVKGNFSQTGGTLSNTLANSTAALVFNGTAAQTASFSGAIAGLNVTLNNAAGLTLQSNLTVPGTLTLTSGKIHTAANTVSLSATGNSLSGGTASNYIDGNLERAVAAGASTVAFPIGDANNYAPVSLAFDAGNTAGTVAASTTASGAPPAGSGLSQSKYINRNWVLSSSIPTASYAATFTYINPGDVVGGANTSALTVAKNLSGTWTNPAVASSVAPTVTTTAGLTSFGTFYLGETGACSTNTFSGTGNWTDGSKWSCGAPPASGDAVIIAAGANATLNTNFTVGSTFTMNATSSLTVRPTATLAVNGTANFNNQSVTFQSDNTGTASLGQVSGTLSGATNVTIERYIPNNGFRSWRLLSVPVITAQTIRQAWQEGDANPLPKDNNLPGRGAQITGVFTTQDAAAAAGFDSTSVSAGMQRYNGTAWTNITSTNQPINNFNSYFLYIRGERSLTVSGSVTNSSATTLRTRGTVYTGDQVNNVGANAFALIPNLYPSAINFTGLTRTGGVNNLFYIWDSKKLNGNSLGTYQTFSATNNFNCLIGGGSYTLGQPNTTIESGQSFFVTSSAAGTVTLKEAAKLSGTNGSLGFRPTAKTKIDTRLYNSQNEMLDANTVVFDAAYEKAIGAEDAPKMGNPGANFAIENNSKLLAIEGTKPLADKDAIQFRMWNLQPQAYTLEFDAANLKAEGFTATLEDSYLNTSTPVNLSGNTIVHFTVDGNTRSSAANRFRIVFSKAEAATAEGFTIAPNPVENGIIKVECGNQPAGKYSIRVVTAAGQLVTSKQINHAGGNLIQNVQLAGAKTGVYTVEIINASKQKTTQQVLVK